ncbi:DnaJ-domain-containing protein [Polyplosphaeria fusca]|uniref:DnaJ-domain-containing protein n=1 Tax=Polyplosphaeria fusca TaxID=682080 RepID=A0A9P4UST9_9PLEO|nr:DnaJ-domain-containing protein [Polyplosphaeria fusca]
MVCPPITEDYYMILEVEQNAAPQLIVSSYKRLALKLHPDKNARHDATEAFQRLGRAYETLKDESKRRAYDLIYPSITRSRASPQSTQTPRPSTASTPRSEALSEAAQIAAIQKSKQERSARWRTRKNAFESPIDNLKGRIQHLGQEIMNLDSIFAAEAAAEAQKNSWGAWLLSPIYKKAEDSDEEKERKDRARQERRIEKDIKERRLELYKADLKTQENLFKKAREEVDAADRCDDEKIRVIQARIMARENRDRQERQRQERERLEKERLEREWLERERMANFWKQQQERVEQQRREMAEASRKRQTAAEQQRKKARESSQQYAHPNTSQGGTGKAHTSTCRHEGWWPKVQGRTDCPECGESWTYLLQCPSCEKRACPRCQAEIRHARTNRRGPPPRVRTPSPDFGYDYDWD